MKARVHAVPTGVLWRITNANEVSLVAADGRIVCPELSPQGYHALPPGNYVLWALGFRQKMAIPFVVDGPHTDYDWAPALEDED